MIKVETIVAEMTDYVNTFNLERNQEFCQKMSHEHRTLQQSFTRLCLD